MSVLSKRIGSKLIFYGCGPALLPIAGLRAQQKSTIEVILASYGLNLSSTALGNMTKWVKSDCDMKRSWHLLKETRMNPGISISRIAAATRSQADTWTQIRDARRCLRVPTDA